MRKRLIIGIGNDMRGDDGVGLLVARLLQSHPPPGATVLQSSGEGAALMDHWRGYDTVIVVDAASSDATAGSAPGTVHRFDLDDGPLPTILSSSFSSHAFGLAEAIELARQLQRLPPRLILYAIEGKDFTVGHPITPSVTHAAHELAQHLQKRLAQSPLSNF